MSLAGNTLDLVRSVFQRDETIPIGPDYFNDLDQGFIDMGSATLSGPHSGGQNSAMEDSVRLGRNLMARYSDYENMEEFPELGSALDLYADDATVQDVITNRSLWFEAEDAAIESTLEDLVKVSLKAEDVLWEQARSLCKYGNNFEELIVADGMGVVKTVHHTPPTVRRIEDHNGVLHGYISDLSMGFGVGTREFFNRLNQRAAAEGEEAYDEYSLTKKYSALDNVKVYEPWEMAHFRLRGKNRKDLYGYSILEPARSAWKRLSMIEDAMVLYKLCLARGTRVWTPDGYTEIQDLKEGDEVYCFSDFEVMKTRVNYVVCNGEDKLYKVKGRNREIYANATHPVLVSFEDPFEGPALRYVEVKDLKPGVHSFVTPPCSGLDYEDTKIKGFRGDDLTYKVAQLSGFLVGQGLECGGFKSLLNDLLTARYKSLYEAALDCKLYSSTIDGQDVYLVSGDEKERKRVVDLLRSNGLYSEVSTKDDTAKTSIRRWLFRQDFETQHGFFRGVFDSSLAILQEVKEGSYYKMAVPDHSAARLMREALMQMGYSVSLIEPLHAKQSFFYEFFVFMTFQDGLDPIESVEFHEDGEIWDIGVDDDCHNFIADGAVVHNTRSPQRYAYYVDVGDVPPNSVKGYLNRIKNDFKKEKFIDPATGKMSQRYNPLSQDEDIFLPVSKGKRSSEVEVLSGPEGQQIDDAEYFLNKIFAAIKIPKSFLGADETAGRANLSTQDIRFARSVLRVQRGIKSGYNHIARVDLSAKNIDPDRAQHECRMVVPSGVFELAQIEVQTAKLELAEKYKDANFSEYFLWSNILGMSDEDILSVQQQRAKENASNLDEEESEQMQELLPKAVDRAMSTVDKNAQKYKSEILAEIEGGNNHFSKKMRELKSFSQEIKQAIKTNRKKG